MTRKNLEPLKQFNAQLVQAPLQGLLRNTESELARRFQQAMVSRERMAERTFSFFSDIGAVHNSLLQIYLSYRFRFRRWLEARKEVRTRSSAG
jgi:hypothetical protein